MPVAMARGGVAPTITGDHENRVTDYTAIAVIGNTASNASITDGETSPTLLGTRGGHGEMPIVLLGVKDETN